MGCRALVQDTNKVDALQDSMVAGSARISAPWDRRHVGASRSGLGAGASTAGHYCLGGRQLH